MDIKSTLKEAREAIKNKNYETSLKLCKQILKQDKENYTALVFMGVSLQETGKAPNAVKSFKDATRVNPTNALAWNGLVNYYEKAEDDQVEANTELVKSYIALLNIETNEKKLLEYASKLSKLQEFGNVDDIASAIHALIESKKCSEEVNLWCSLVALLSKSRPADLDKMYEDGLKTLLSTQRTICTEYYEQYLNLLYKQNRIEELLEAAKKMHELFTINSSSLKWICKVYNENFVESGRTVIESDEHVRYFYESLLKLESESPNALFTKAVLLVRQDKYAEARELLKQVVKACPLLLHAWVLLAKCCNKLVLFSETVSAASKIEKLTCSKKNVEGQLNVILVEAFSKSDEEDKLKKALEIYETMTDDAKLNCLPYIIRANISLKNFVQAKLLLNDLKKDAVTSKLLTAQMLRSQSNFAKALEVLMQHEDDVALAEWWMEIGLLHRNLGERKNSLMPFLKAAKLEPNNYKCFLLLGHYYRDSDDLDKARRCYEKSFKINSKCAEAGVELSKIYLKLKNWDANLALLESLTTDVINKKNSWAWMQLGLNYLDQEEYEKAINNLRYVIRIDESNMHCWESLADAYSAKGAYTSALKCYAKASELSNSAVYPLLQMANIKQKLGEFAEARENFEEILRSDKSYVPALKGIAETCLCQAQECYADQRLGTARDHAQYAADKLIVAIQQRSDLACLWKLLGDSCLFVTKLPEKFCCMLLIAAFVAGDESLSGKKILEKDELFVLATRCYCKCLHLDENNILVWHDLATCYLSHARNADDKELFGQLIDKAESVIQHCISKNPTYWQHWNLLGNVAVNQDPPNYRLAQHAFIKAVIADNNSSTAWCNLGTLYLILGDFKLSNEAFSEAQRSDPNYVNSWVGQALLAENCNLDDAMDLFRHSTQLGIHQQGALGYAHWVCQTLMNSSPDDVIYSIHNMHAIPVACDVLTWYTEKNPDDGSAWNMLGILRERMGLKSGAMAAFRTALCLSRREHQDLARVNYGRMLCKLQKYPEAIQMFEKVEAASFKSGSGLALALFKNKQYKESYDAYESALHWLTEEESSQSDLLVALAAMAYMFEGAEAAKLLLFQSIRLEKPSPWGFFAILSIGLLHEDINLAELVYNELSVLKDQKEQLQHYSVLSSYFYLLQGNLRKSVCEVSKLVHRYPDQAGVWLTLSTLLIRLHKARQPSVAAAKCAQIAMKLGQANMDVTKVLCLVSLSSLISGRKEAALVAAQKAVHCYPNVLEAWSVLAAALMATKKLGTSRIQIILDHISGSNASENLMQWTRKVAV